MKDYSAMSDLEINIEVAVNQGFDREKCELGWSGKPDVGVEWSERTGYPIRSFNYCNNPADAWLIITANHIGIMPFKSGGATAWPTSVGLLSNAQVKHANPLRACMIVYLQMMEQKS